MLRARSTGELALQSPTDVDDVVGDHAEPDPALYADLASVTATVEPMPALDHTMRPSHPVRHFWPLREPTLPLFAFVLDALG